MQISDTGATVLSGSQETYSGKLSGQACVLLGLVILAAVAFAFASLATWSINDPSLSNANGKSIQNAAGYSGAVLADLAMQFFGLASAVAIVAPAIWGWLLLLQRPIGIFKRRLVAWPAGVLLITAGLGCVLTPQSWPLPSGLGGVVGDMILKAPAMLSGGYPSGILAVLLFIVFFVPGFGLTVYATGLIGTKAAEDDDEFALDDETEEVDTGSVSSWLFGAATHWYLLARAKLRKRRQNRESAMAPNVELDVMDRRDDSELPIEVQKPSILQRIKDGYAKLTAPPDDGLEGVDYSGRMEPGFSPNYDEHHMTGMDGDPYGAMDPDHPAYGENVYGRSEPGQEHSTGDEEWAEHPPVVEVENSHRVKSAAPKPKPSKRIARESQHSLLSNADFELPSLHFLSEPKNIVKDSSISTEALEQNARMLEGVLEDFGVKGEIINVRPGPVVTLYELEPAPGIKSSRVIGLADDIARSMSAVAARVAVVSGRNAIGIELPNQRRETVYLREMLGSQSYESSKAKLPLILGKTIGGEPVIADLAKMPHLLMAGTTGSGKSVAINTMILSILYRLSPEKVKMIMIDPKMLELSIYDGIPHLLTPVVTDPKKAVVALKWTVREMEERYKKMSKLGVRNIDGYNSRLKQAVGKGESLSRTIQTGYDRDTGEAIYETESLELEPMPFIVVVIDEMADLMMVAGKDIEGTIQRLAQIGRASCRERV